MNALTIPSCYALFHLILSYHAASACRGKRSGRLDEEGVRVGARRIERTRLTSSFRRFKINATDMANIAYSDPYLLHGDDDISMFLDFN